MEIIPPKVETLPNPFQASSAFIHPEDFKKINNYVNKISGMNPREEVKVKAEQKKALWEAVKEVGRVIVLAIIPVLIAGLEAGDVNLKVLAVIGVVAVLKGIDRMIHKSEKIKAGGLVPF